MAFKRLLERDRGRIILLNLSQTVREGLLEPQVERELLLSISDKLDQLPPEYSDDQLYDSVKGVVWNNRRFRLAAREAPNESLRISAVRTFGELLPLLQRIGEVNELPEVDSLVEPPTIEALERAAEILNEYMPQMPHLTLGRGFNTVWATCQSRLQGLLDQADDVPHAVRDSLGLVHLRPGDAGGAIHLFLFEGQIALAEAVERRAFRVVRPTTLDGFTNWRFRQWRPEVWQELGCGGTVDLANGAFSDGLPEMISTEIPLRDFFICRYIGRVIRDPEGNDSDFIAKLSRDHDPAAAADDLNRRLAATV